jgi:hypothetical protein
LCRLEARLLEVMDDGMLGHRQLLERDIEAGHVPGCDAPAGDRPLPGRIGVQEVGGLVRWRRDDDSVGFHGAAVAQRHGSQPDGGIV